MRPAAALLLFSACGAPPPAAPAPAPRGGCDDLSGAWALTETIDRSACGEPTETLTFPARWSQDGCRGTLTVPLTGIALDGSVSGSTLSASGTYRDAGRVEKSVTLTRSGDTLSGTARWRWSLGGALSCAGTSTFTGARAR